MRGTWQVAKRILLGLRGDRATLAFVLGVPVFIFFLMGEVLDSVPPGRFNTDFIDPVMVAVFVFMLTYVLTGIGFLRERQTGTLERVLASPLPRTSLVLGYMLGFGILAMVQASVILGAGVWFLDIGFKHSVLAFYGIELMAAMTALGIGILVSLLARSEFQVLQGIPLVITPQVLLGGVFVGVDRLPIVLEVVARALPLTYILDAMSYLVLDQGSADDLGAAVAVMAAYIVATLGAAALVVRRRA